MPARVHDRMVIVYQLLVCLHLLLRQGAIPEAECIGQATARRTSGERTVTVGRVEQFAEFLRALPHPAGKIGIFALSTFIARV